MTNVARKGMKFEKAVAFQMNNYFVNNLLENVAHANGGAGKGSDVVITGPGGDMVHSYEVKTSKGSRVDFGQFRISYDEEKGWQQATGLKSETQIQVFNHIKEDGIYLCEDIHTSYWLYFGGGFKRRGTFVEFSKNFIDQLNAFHSEQKQLRPNKFTHSVDSIHYYDSVLVIHKKRRTPPKNIVSGKISFDNVKISNYSPNIKPFRDNRLLIIINKILRFFKFKSIVWK